MTPRDPMTSGSGQAGTSRADQFNQSADQAQEKLGQARDKAAEVKDQMTSKVSDVREQATAKSDQGLDQASQGLGQAADLVRKQAEGDGPVPAQAAMVADRLEQASSYFKDKNTNEIVSDLETFVRSKPMESVVGAVAIGFVLAKILR
ncbi:MAG TPA: hypothetical protein VGT61_01120 [Thermomicrobiales bacterium]|nr:hypothetical protein [Thermomicrobiales bacterium]